MTPAVPALSLLDPPVLELLDEQVRVLGFRVPELAPWVLLAGCTTAVAVALAHRRRSLRERLVTALWIAWAGGALSVTITPLPRGSLRGAASGERDCHAVPELITPVALLADGQRLLNVLMLIPLGLLPYLAGGPAGTLPRGRRVLLGGAVSLPLVVEGVQYLLPGLARSCDAKDIVDNLSGVLLGVLAGTALAALRHRRLRRARLGTGPAAPPPGAGAGAGPRRPRRAGRPAATTRRRRSRR